MSTPDEELSLGDLANRRVTAILAQDDEFRRELLARGDLTRDEHDAIVDRGTAEMMVSFRASHAYRYLSAVARAQVMYCGQRLGEVDLDSREARMLQAHSRACMLFDQWITTAISIGKQAEAVLADLGSDYDE